jgi:uncharacterized protein YecE (DUF72 family)
MDCFVGTSGWSYSWNPEGSFDWFVTHSGLNAVELNMSFYRYPYPNMVRGWALKVRVLRWSIKVQRLITHTLKLNEKAYIRWERFSKLFAPLEPYIDLYLFQLPPILTPKYIQAIEKFITKTELSQRFALEVRNMKWFDKNYIEWASKLNVTWVSVVSPDFPLEIYNTDGIVYLRMHGRTAWYSHYYTDEELEEVAQKIVKTNTERVYVFFNNKHAMLEDARRMLQIMPAR